jgi:sulfonate transport system substrate-binding protein
MKMKVEIVALFVALGATAAVAEDKPDVIRIGVASVGTGNRPITGGSFTAIAADQGSVEEEFKKDGIAVKYTYFAGAGPAVNEALANRQLDFAYQGDLPALVAKAGGLKTKLILAAGRDSPIYLAVPSDSTAKSIEDLKGKRIAVFKGTNGQLAFWNFLAAKGLKDTDFKIINMSTYDGNAALLSRDIDAQVSGNDLFPLVDRGVARIIGTTKGDRRLGRLSHVLVTEEFEAKYPQLVQRLVNVLLKAAAWEIDPSRLTAVYQIWSKSGLSYSSYKQDFEGYKLAERDSPLFDDFYRAHYKRQLQAGQDLKLVRRSFDVDSWIDGRYLDRGLKDLGLEGRWKQDVADFTIGPKASN